RSWIQRRLTEIRVENALEGPGRTGRRSQEQQCQADGHDRRAEDDPVPQDLSNGVVQVRSPPWRVQCESPLHTISPPKASRTKMKRTRTDAGLDLMRTFAPANEPTTTPSATGAARTTLMYPLT